ncbi:MAG: hypothetical protein LQ345_002519 [Seirophora villosa]|nr:MAG: hypothetical protein LQ345_002519 [Seirophora villosa]
MAHAMSDDQVAGELKKMTAFIRQEALEKAKEIQIKADEEFAIEKSKLVRQETSSIDSQYEKKFKQAGMSQQITRSTLANKTRIKVLSARQELLDELFDQAREKLADHTKDKGEYQTLCQNLILEGLYALNEDKVAIRARKEDYDIVKKAMEGAKEEYKNSMQGREVQLELDEKNPQSEGCSGGVSVVGGGGRIDINNTLDERLKLLETEALPMVRASLFGKNENRRFQD